MKQHKTIMYTKVYSSSVCLLETEGERPERDTHKSFLSFSLALFFCQQNIQTMYFDIRSWARRHLRRTADVLLLGDCRLADAPQGGAEPRTYLEMDGTLLLFCWQILMIIVSEECQSWEHGLEKYWNQNSEVYLKRLIFVICQKNLWAAKK